jgi:hypothetical protein
VNSKGRQPRERRRDMHARGRGSNTAYRSEPDDCSDSSDNGRESVCASGALDVPPSLAGATQYAFL